MTDPYANPDKGLEPENPDEAVSQPADPEMSDGVPPSAAEAASPEIVEDMPETARSAGTAEAAALPEEPPGRESPPPAPHPVLTDILTQIKQLQSDFETKLKYDAHKEVIVDRLHQELQAHKRDLLGDLMKPLLLDLIALYDDFDKLISHHREGGAQSFSPDGLSTLVNFQTYVSDILEKHGVHRYSNPEAKFDPRTQQALQVLTTTDAEQNRFIASRLRPGFKWNERLIRPEGVAVFAYRKAEPSQTNQNQQNQQDSSEKED